MTVKEYLTQLEDLNKSVEDQKEYVLKLRETVTSIGGMKMDDRVKSSPDPDKLGSMIAKIDEEQDKLEDMEERLYLLRFQIIDQIHHLEDTTLKHLLMLKYVDYDNYPTLHFVASKLGYSYDYTKDLHQKALFELGKILAL